MTTPFKINVEELQGAGRDSEASCIMSEEVHVQGKEDFVARSCLGRQPQMGFLSCILDLGRSSREH